MIVTAGVDPAGGSHDRAAVVVVEHVILAGKPRPKGHLDKIVRRVVRLPALATYGQQADTVVEVMSGLPAEADLVVEAGGGYGTGVIEFLEEARLAGRLRQRPSPMHLTSQPGPVELAQPQWPAHYGAGTTTWVLPPRRTSIPKVELYTYLAREARAGRVHIAPGVKDADQLRVELLGMANDETPTGRLTFNSDSVAGYDDLFCATALAARFHGRTEPRSLLSDGSESSHPMCRLCGSPVSSQDGQWLHSEYGHGDHFAQP